VPTSPTKFMDAAESFLRDVEASKLVSQAELASVRRELVRDVKREAKQTVKSLQTAKVGNAKILVPNSENLKKINLSSERIRTRMSSFRLSYLDRTQVANLTADGTLSGDPRKFIRHSRRMAKHTREFLKEIAEEEPSLQEEVDATLGEMEDNDMDLLKLEVKSMTRMKETMLRAVNGRKQRGQVLKEIDDYDMNRSLFNLSLHEHPDAVARQLLGNATDRMASAVTTKISEIPKLAHVYVGLPPQAAAAMTPASRTGGVAFRLFDTKTIDKRLASLPATQAAKGSRRGLGMGFNTKEWYIPVPPALVEGLAPLAAARRASAMGAAEARAAEASAAKVARQANATRELSTTVSTGFARKPDLIEWIRERNLTETVSRALPTALAQTDRKTISDALALLASNNPVLMRDLTSELVRRRRRLGTR
jgi:hypothetical protein